MADAAEDLLDLDTTPGDGPTSVNGVSAQELRDLIRRIENLEEQKKGIADDIALTKKEAKANGFDVKTINTIVKLRKKDAREIEEEETLLVAYQRALGMID